MSGQVRGRHVRRGVLGVLPLLLVAGCSASQEPPVAGPAAPPPFADCAVLTSPPVHAAATAHSSAAGAQGATGPTAVPDIELPCFTGGEAFSLSSLRGPAVINLWASWCQPCQAELPVFQRLAVRAGDRLHVLGVDTRDGRPPARSTGERLGLTFPSLFDSNGRLRAELGRAALPVTVLVDGQGRIRYIHDTGALDDATLATLLDRHLGMETS